MTRISSLVLGLSANKSSTINFLFFLSAFNCFTSAIETVKSTSSSLSNDFTRSFQALNFEGVNTVESFTPNKIRFPSSPKISKNLLYWIFASWSWGSKLASVWEKRMFLVFVTKKAVIKAITNNTKYLLRIIKPAILVQNVI